MNGIDLALVLAILGIVGAGLNAGVYLTFSTFTMAGLRRLPASQGAAAMQAINLEAPTAGFMSIFFGTAIVSLALAALAIIDFDAPGSSMVIAGAASYVSTIVITGIYNVPLNDRLAAVDPASPHGTSTWADYQRRWARGNHVRLLASAAAAILLTLSLLV
ncbi:MAG: anthrone oxygenase family protein [Chloroflexota bacterium]|nr:anthrone oxygenase family protein [Chloroflexota bacterium]